MKGAQNLCSFPDSIILFFIKVTKGNGTVYIEVKCVES